MEKEKKVETFGTLQTEEATPQDYVVTTTAASTDSTEIPTQITPATIARTVCLALAIINQALVHFGIQPIPFVEEELYELISLAATFITAGIAWWKNNSFTKSAITADAFLKALKGKD